MPCAGKLGNFLRLELSQLSFSYLWRNNCKAPFRPKFDRQDGPNVSGFAPLDTDESDIAARCIDAAWEATAIAAVPVVTMEDHSTCTWTALHASDSFLPLHDCYTTQR